MGGKLVKESSQESGTKIRIRELPFRVAFEVSLQNGYEIKDMAPAHIGELHRFIADTVYKKLTISEVDKLYLRKRGLSDAPSIKFNDKDLIHYGKDRNTFRLFGYYNQDGYFVVCRIDGNHKTHKD